jgi:hypothetical protein
MHPVSLHYNFKNLKVVNERPLVLFDTVLNIEYRIEIFLNICCVTSNYPVVSHLNILEYLASTIRTIVVQPVLANNIEFQAYFYIPTTETCLPPLQFLDKSVNMTQTGTALPCSMNEFVYTFKFDDNYNLNNISVVSTVTPVQEPICQQMSGPIDNVIKSDVGNVENKPKELFSFTQFGF